MRAFAYLGIAWCLLPPSQATAQQPTFEIAVGGSTMRVDRAFNAHLASFGIADQQPGVLTYGLGGSIGYNLPGSLGIRIGGESLSGNGATALSLFGAISYALQREGVFSPYATVGLGFERFSRDSIRITSEFSAQLGVGVRYDLKPSMAVRFEARMAAQDYREFQPTVYNSTLTLGLLFAFGRRSKPADLQPLELQSDPPGADVYVIPAEDFSDSLLRTAGPPNFRVPRPTNTRIDKSEKWYVVVFLLRDLCEIRRIAVAREQANAVRVVFAASNILDVEMRSMPQGADIYLIPRALYHDSLLSSPTLLAPYSAGKTNTTVRRPPGTYVVVLLLEQKRQILPRVRLCGGHDNKVEVVF